MFVGCGNNGGTGKIGLTTISHTAAWTSSGAAITLGGAVFDCRASPFNNKIAVDISNRVTIYDSALTNPVPRTAGFTAYSKLVWDPLADFLMYIDTNGNQLFSLNVATGTPTQALATGNTLFACDFSPNGKYIATGGNEKKLFLLDSTRMLTETWLTSDQIKGIAMTKDENTKLFVGDILG
jgi:WD40 repeat protein